MTTAGFVAIAGRPNSGKSTLLNRIVGQKLGIVSSKPQSTRNRVVGIVTRDSSQMVILDTPGLLAPEHLLHTSMRQSAQAAISDADAVVHLVDATERRGGVGKSLAEQASMASHIKAPIFLAYNKIDALSENELEVLTAQDSGAHFISALNGEGVDHLLDRVAAAMPESEFLYPEDEISSQPVRFFVAEMIRETALEMLDEEVPYGLACEIEEYREGSKPVYIRAVLHVERPSQKAIVVGAGGTRIREIGKASRGKVEEFLGESVYLDLWVKVLRNWRRNPSLLRRLGYHLQEDKQQ